MQAKLCSPTELHLSLNEDPSQPKQDGIKTEIHIGKSIFSTSIAVLIAPLCFTVMQLPDSAFGANQPMPGLTSQELDEPCANILQEQKQILEIRRLIDEATPLRHQGTAKSRLQEIDRQIAHCPQIKKILRDELAFIHVIRQDNAKSEEANRRLFDKFASELSLDENTEKRIDQRNASEKCYSINLANRFAAPNTQAPYDWSFAFSASDLASRKLGKPVSALDITNSTAINSGLPDALRTNSPDSWLHNAFTSSSAQLSEFKTASPLKALESARKIGFCSQEYLADRGINEQSLLVSIKEIEKSRSKLAEGLVFRCNTSWLQIFKGTGLLGLGRAITGTSPEDVIKSLINNSCLERIQPKTENFEVLSKKNQVAKESRQSIRQLLDAQNAATLTFSGDLFDEDKSRPASLTLVGRHFNRQTSQCEYSLKADFREACSSQSQLSARDYTCQNGYFTINEDRLLYHLKEITWIK